MLLLIKQAKSCKKEELLTSEIYQKHGESLLEIGLYHDAIEALSKSIEKDPNNFSSYFFRAVAYFEDGDFDRSIEDYINSKESRKAKPYEVPPDFMKGYIEALCRGASESACDFIPSLCNSVYGIGECLWVFGQHPVESLQNFAAAGHEIMGHVVEYIKTIDQAKLDQYSIELVKLCERFDNLDETEKGELFGYAIGRHGVDIAAGCAVFEGVAAYKKLRDANRACNFESMLLSNESKESVLSSSLEHNLQRSKYFENIEIEWGKQEKHILGKNNYDPSGTKSILEHKDPAILLKKYAGKGIPVTSSPGKPGFREVVDFKENIGLWKSMEGASHLKTTRGTIHYSKKEAHIVPAKPKELL